MPANRITPPAFIAKWKPVTLSERSAAQQHFLDLCELLGQPKAADVDPTGEWYTFERGASTTNGGKGWADVWRKGYFAWEYKRKGKHKELSDAYKQLLKYREALENPPLLVVSDIARIEIHTNFTGTAKEIHRLELERLGDPDEFDLLRKLFSEPDSLKPGHTTSAVTENAAAIRTDRRQPVGTERPRPGGVPVPHAADVLHVRRGRGLAARCRLHQDLAELPPDAGAAREEAGTALPQDGAGWHLRAGAHPAFQRRPVRRPEGVGDDGPER